jgi:hypothetical protein
VNDREDSVESYHSLPKDVVEILVRLRAVRQVTKELPSLPKGELRDRLENKLSELSLVFETSADKACNSIRDQLSKAQLEVSELKSNLKKANAESIVHNDTSPMQETYISGFRFRWLVLSFVIGFSICLLTLRNIPRDATIPEEKVVPSLKP